MAVDGSLVFNTKIDVNGFNKDSKQLSSKILGLKNKVSITEREVNKLTSELDALAKTKIKSRTVEDLEKSVEKAKAKLSELEGKAEEIFHNTRSDLSDIGFDDKHLDSILSQNHEWNKLQKEIAQVDDEVQRYTSQLKNAESTSILGTDTEEYAKKKEKLVQLIQKLDVYKSQLAEAERREEKFTKETENSSKTLKKFISEVKKLGKKILSTFNGVATKGIKSFTSSLKKLFTQTKKTNSQMGSIAKSINRIKQAIGGMLLYKVIQGGIEALKESLQEMAKVSPSVNKNLSALMSSFTYMKNSLATAFMPILTVVTPILTRFMDTLSLVINKIGEFISALTGQSTYTKAIKLQQNYAESLDDSTSSVDKNTKAVKGNEKALAGYDELNVMQDNSTESTGNVDSDSNAPMYKTIATPFSDFANELKKAFKQGDYGEIAKIIVEKLNSALSKINWTLIGTTLSNGLKSALSFLYVLIGNFNWFGLGKGIGDMINASLSQYNASLFAKTLSDLFIGILTTITKVINTIKWNRVSATIIAFLSNLKWSNISRVVIGFVNSLAKAIKTFDFKGIGTAFRNGLSKINWKNLWNSITDLLSNALQGITDFFGLKGVNTSPINKAVKNLYIPISKLFTTLKNTVNTLLEPIINNLLPSIVTVIGDIAKGLNPIIQSLSPVLNTVIEVASSVMTTLSPVISSIGNMIGGIIKVLSPFLEPIKTIITGVMNILAPAISTIFDTISFLLEPLSSVTSMLGDILTKFVSPFESETITEKMQSEIDNLKITTEELKTIVDDTKTAIENTETSLSAVTDETSEIDSLKQRLQELVEKTNLTPEEQKEMKTVADLLAEKVPGFETTWDNLTETDDKGKLPERHSRLILFVTKEVKGCIYNLLIRYLTKINRNKNNAR